MMQRDLPAPVRGCCRTGIIPHIRKIDLMSSNSYILSGEDMIALIDPGALDDQWDMLVQRMLGLIEERARPVVIYLTHSHLDHCFQLRRCRDDAGLGRVAVAVQEKGAEALQTRDRRLTLAGLLGRDMFSFFPDISLLSNQDIASPGECRVDLDGATLSYSTRVTETCQGTEMISQQFHLGGGDLLEIYPLPGHSPDSICLRAGSLLFLGDLFFAPNPGTAGAYGWSQPDLLASIERVLWIMGQRDISLCFQGHGRAIDADQARLALRSMYQDVLSLSGLEEINPLWARSTAAYAQDLMAELERLFIIMTGRLAYTAYVLDAIEEAGEAGRLQSLIDSEEIDDLFEKFHQFVLELRYGRRLNWELVHKAGQMMGKLDRVIEECKLGPLVNQSLLSRATRILNDYSITYRGFWPNFCASSFDINALLRESVAMAEFKPYDEAAIIEAEDHESYLNELRARIDHIDLFERVPLELQASPSLPEVRLDRERFVESMTDLLERLAGKGAKRLRISTAKAGDLISVRISLGGDFCGHILEKGELRFLERAFALCGCFIQIGDYEGGPGVEIELLPASVFEDGRE